MTAAARPDPVLKADLSGLTALVTGASSGFGRSFAATLAALGAEVIVAARRRAPLDQLVGEIVAWGGKARAVTMDVADADSVTAAFAEIDRVDIVVNNAGVSGPPHALETTDEAWREVYAINVEGALRVAKAAARVMIAGKTGGSIINIASITGIRPAAAAPAYSSSKAALIHLTKGLAGEWARHGIRVNAIAPGYFFTDLTREFLDSDYGKKLVSRVPQRRLGELPELDGPLVLLASPASSYMTGSVIEVDGGHLASPL